MKQTSKQFYYFLIPIISVLLDQITKNIILSKFQYGERLNIIPNFFDLTLLFNKGAAFSFLANAGGWTHYFFLSLSIIVCVYLIYAIIKKHFNNIGTIGAALVLGGALGNVTDRLIHGHVIDFLLFYYQTYYYPAFNIADSSICLGALCLILGSSNLNKKHEE